MSDMSKTSDLTKIGPSLLEMDDVAQYLNVKGLSVKDKDGNEKGFYPFISTKDKATDVKAVAEVDASKIAVSAASPKNNFDRTTVRNAENLDNHPINYFLTAAQGSGMLSGISSIRKEYSREIQQLRDELQQLRSELAKKGIVKSYAPYSGFYDTFRNGKPVHEYAVLATPIRDSVDQYSVVVQDDAYLKFSVGDRIFIRDEEKNTDAVVEISKCEPDMQTIRFTPACGFDIRKGKCSIFKSKGSIIDGYYTFGKITDVVPGDKEYYTCLDDDTYRMRKKINKSHSGFGYTFRVPQNMQKNFLAGVDILVKKFGEPGDLMCYIIDERDVQNWKNADKAIEDGIVIAKSQPLHVNANLDEYQAEFNFYDGATYPRLMLEDDSEHKVRYCMIIEALEADESSNYYEVVFLQNKHEDGTFGDLQLNNTTYQYNSREDKSAESALVTDKMINDMDMYYGLRLKKAIDSCLEPFHDGIYTAHFSTHEPVEVNHARLAMRIRREGIFSVSSEGTSFSEGNADAIKDNGVVVVEGETNDDVRGFEGCIGHDIVIGTEIRRLKMVDENKLTISTGTPLAIGDPVYPIGYKAKLKARRKTWNPQTCRMEYGPYTTINLPLTTVMPDMVHADEFDSDRLIFENDMLLTDEERDAIKTLPTYQEKYASDFQNGKYIGTDKSVAKCATLVEQAEAKQAHPKKFNDFELQISWQQSAQKVSDRIMGQIRMLDVALDTLP